MPLRRRWGAPGLKRRKVERTNKERTIAFKKATGRMPYNKENLGTTKNESGLFKDQRDSGDLHDIPAARAESGRRTERQSSSGYGAVGGKEKLALNKKPEEPYGEETYTCNHVTCCERS